MFSWHFRKLGTAGQKLGGSAVLCHIKHDPIDPAGCFTLTSANVGKCQSVLCRNGKPLPLSRSYLMNCEEELRRIKQHKAIITEVRDGTAEGKSNGFGKDLLRVASPSKTDASESQTDSIAFLLLTQVLSSSLNTGDVIERKQWSPPTQQAMFGVLFIVQSGGHVPSPLGPPQGPPVLVKAIWPMPLPSSQWRLCLHP